MIQFEKVSKFSEVDINLPERKTTNSAGYDFVVAEDTLIPSYYNMMSGFKNIISPYTIIEDGSVQTRLFDLESMANLTETLNVRPTLVSTGMKCQLDPNTYLELSVRSSCPLKYWLVLANGVGVIDADYYNNPDNEGEIFFQLINLSPVDIVLRKGDAIGQGIVKAYLTTANDCAEGQRVGGFGSTSV